jgi:hypothetical protein
MQPMSITKYFANNIDCPNFEDAILLIRQYSK